MVYLARTHPNIKGRLMSDSNHLSRYSRQVFFAGIGEQGQAKLGASSVAVLGCGALGTVVVSSLARAGVGQLHIVDRDFIEENNLQRQILFDEEDIKQGLPKAEAARRKISKINSNIAVKASVTDINYGTIEGLLADTNLVIDATDNFETRFLANDICVKKALPWIYGACIGSSGMTMNIIPGETPCLRCVFEKAPPPDMSPSCDTAGVLNGIVNIIASIQATEAIKFLTGHLECLNRGLRAIDIWSFDTRTFQVGDGPSAECPTCAHHQYDYLNATWGSHSTSLCGRNSVQVTRKDKITVDFNNLEEKLGKLGPVTHNRFMLKFSVAPYDFTVFPDGRAIIQGTDDTTAAKNLYAKYIGA